MLFTLISVLLWLGFVEFLALAMLPLWSSLLASGAHKVLGYSRVLSLLVLTFTLWWLAQYAGTSITPITIGLVTLGLVTAGHCCLRLRFNTWNVFLYDQKLSRAYLGYGCTLLLLLIFRACSPEIFWGEKPLDFSMFNYLTRESQLPAEHPWASGESMSYYYLGFFSLAILQKISLLDPSVGYNIGIAFVGACLFACFESLFLNLRLGRVASYLSALLLTFGANLNPVFFALVEGRAFEFDLFWMTTRNFTPYSFAEYPIWSLLFADLHPHVMATPLVVTLLGLMWSAAFQKQNLNSHQWLLTWVCGALWGLLYAVNGWDFVSASFLLAIGFGFSQPILMRWAWCKRQIAYVLLLSVGAACTVLPFRASQKNLFAAFWGWVTPPEYNNVSHILLHQGGALLLIVLSLFGICASQRCSLRRIIKDKFLILLASFPLLLGAFCAYYAPSGQPWWILLFAQLISFASLAVLAPVSATARSRFCCLLVIAGCVVMCMSETFYLFDRMNTIFKGYQLLWPLFGTAACVLLYDFGFELYSRRYSLSLPRLSLLYGLNGLCYSVIAIMAVGTIINLMIMLPMKRTNNSRFTLYGSDYLEKDNIDEAYLIRWLQENVHGKAYVAEANGDSYQNYARVAMHTGLPTLLGWEYHSKQGGVPQVELEKRKLALDAIFSENDAELAYRWLQYFGTDFVFVGKLEHEKYSASALRKFASRPDLFIPAAWHGDYVLYMTAFSPLRTK